METKSRKQLQQEQDDLYFMAGTRRQAGQLQKKDQRPALFWLKW